MRAGSGSLVDILPRAPSRMMLLKSWILRMSNDKERACVNSSLPFLMEMRDAELSALRMVVSALCLSKEL